MFYLSHHQVINLFYFKGYLYRDYLSWIEQYSIKLSTEDHYGLTMDKKFLADSLENLVKQVLNKVKI